MPKFIIYVEDDSGQRKAGTYSGTAQDGIEKYKKELIAKGIFDADVWAVPIKQKEHMFD